jgi:hypothetical protein
MSVFGAALLAVIFLSGPSRAAPAQPASLQPTTSVPDVSKAPQNQYYVLLIKWTRDARVGPVTVRATYLDPLLYLAWLQQTNPTIDQRTFAADLGNFPQLLRFRMAYQAAKRPDLQGRLWNVSLRESNGQSFAAFAAKRAEPIDLKSGPNGNFWEDDWDYEMKVPQGFLAGSKGFVVELQGPHGKATVNWTFGAVQGAAESSSGYVIYLGATLTTCCILLIAGLYLTRSPRPGIA